MRGWELASLIFFGYIAALAMLPWGRRLRRRGLLLAGAALGLILTVFAIGAPHVPIAHDWFLPPVLLLLGYWTSGLLFVAPIDWQECALLRPDQWLRIPEIAHRLPGIVATALELAYVGVYPLVGIAFIIHVLHSPAPNPVRFWTVILTVDYLCFGLLPWVQTRPPRSLDETEPWSSPIRRFNLQLLGTASIQVNTFPSGHAAEALAAALLTLDATLPAFILVAVGAIGVSAGAVLGRYHYAADAIAGWLVTLVVWAFVVTM